MKPITAVILLGLACSILPLQAQLPESVHIFSTRSQQNPAFTGISGLSRLTFNTRQQWANRPDGSPFDEQIAFEQGFGDTTYHQGWGIYVADDLIRDPLNSKLVTRLSYARELLKRDDHHLRIGLAAGFQQYRDAALIFPDQINPISGFDSTTTEIETLPDLDIGLLYYQQFGFISLSYRRLFNGRYNLELTPGSEVVSDTRAIHFVAGGKIEVLSWGAWGGQKQSLSFFPLVGGLWQGQGDPQPYLGLQAQIAPLSLGWIFRGDKLHAFLLGLSAGPVSLAYSYENYLVPAGPMPLGPSHEISLILQSGWGKKVARALPFPTF
ncbi:MAG: type IX secretion system membrane protein PorP/SprF [Bacteroidota bacterium]